MRRFSLLLFLLAAACSDTSTSTDASTHPDATTPSPDASIDDDAGTTPDAGGDGCRAVALGAHDFEFNLFSQITGLRYAVSPNLDGDDDDALLVELYDSTTGGGLPALTPGTFELGAGVNADLATCQHCVWIKVDESVTGTVAAIYFATEGTMTITAVSDPFEPVFAGSLAGVVLQRATIDDEGHSILEPDGDCVSIASLAFDTSATPGRTCLSAEDCGNPVLEICDPATNTCGEPTCGEFTSCPASAPVCVSQYRDLFFGGCYRSCDPSAAASSCDSGESCVQFGVDPAFGLCKTLGTIASGEACEPEDNGTSCAAGAVCSLLSRTCAASCSFFDATTGCADDTACSLFGVCESIAAGRDVVLGAPCDPSDELARGCASDGESFRGICFAYPPEPPICEKACLGDQGCVAGEFCALRFSSGLGICKPNPICGDGELGEIDELCDDGNTMSGDGCSADCRTVEYDVICSALPVLAIGSTASGDTSIDGFQSTCQLGIAKTSLFTITTTSAGRLTLYLESASDQTIAIRETCADVSTELACENRGAFGEPEELVLQVTSTSASSLTAIVSAFTVLDQGPFALRAEFVAERCGDQIIAGNEVCDDGNTVSDDGCSADCREIEYDFYCASAPELSTAAPNIGDTTDAPRLFENTCSSEAGATSGVDRLYRYTAPSNGVLHLVLASEHNLVVAVLDGCGAPADVTPLACNSVFTLGNVDVALTAGQMITVLVDGFIPGELGAYSLEASFTP